MHRRLRLTLIGIAAFLAALVIAVVVAAYVMLQPQRFTDLLRAQARQAGLNLALSTPAEPSLWPQPAVVMHGLTLTANNRPVLVAAQARLVVPWRALLGGPPAITRLELEVPRINLAQIGPVLARMPHGQSGPPVMPHVDAGIRVSHGSLVRGSQVLLGDISLETGPLAPGRVFTMQLAGKSAHGHAATLTLQMTPHTGTDAIRFDNIHLTASGPPDVAVELAGNAVWHGGASLAMTLKGTLARSARTRYAMELALAPASDTTPLQLHLKLDGPGLAADLHMSPVQLADWWRAVSSGGALVDIPLPPLRGNVQAKSIQFGDTRIEGLHLTTTPALPASAATPAAAASTRR